MAANAGTKLYQVVQNLERLLAIECIAASQALAFRSHRISTKMKMFVDQFRTYVPIIDHDRVLSQDIDKAICFLRELDLGKLQFPTIE